jgi:hypothetical protein
LRARARVHAPPSLAPASCARGGRGAIPRAYHLASLTRPLLQAGLLEGPDSPRQQRARGGADSVSDGDARHNESGFLGGDRSDDDGYPDPYGNRQPSSAKGDTPWPGHERERDWHRTQRGAGPTGEKDGSRRQRALPTNGTYRTESPIEDAAGGEAWPMRGRSYPSSSSPHDVMPERQQQQQQQGQQEQHAAGFPASVQLLDEDFQSLPQEVQSDQRTYELMHGMLYPKMHGVVVGMCESYHREQDCFQELERSRAEMHHAAAKRQKAIEILKDAYARIQEVQQVELVWPPAEQQQRDGTDDQAGGTGDGAGVETPQS